MNKKGTKDFLAQYLSGQVSQEERTELEDRYFADDDLFEEIVAVENELIDLYVQGKLTALEMKQCETCLLTTAERRQQIEFARSLMQ